MLETRGSAKRAYVYATLAANLRLMLSDDMANAILAAWLGTAPVRAQSLPNPAWFYLLPLEYSGKGISKPFFDAFKQFVYSPEVSIDLDDVPVLVFKGTKLNMAMFTATVNPRRINCIVRKDDQGFWSIYSDGFRHIKHILFSDLTYIPVKTSVPEYVTVNVAKHNPRAALNVLEKLCSAEVFGVNFVGNALPNELDFLTDIARSKNIVAKVHIPNANFVADTSFMGILNHTAEFSYSVSTLGQVLKVDTRIQKASKYLTHDLDCIYEYSLATLNIPKFEEILNYVLTHGRTLVLCGAVDTSIYPDPLLWLKAIKDKRSEGYKILVALDEKAMECYGRVVQFEGVANCFYEINNKAFSCYIDSVTKRMAPSGYSERQQYKAFDEDWLKHYSTFSIC